MEETKRTRIWEVERLDWTGECEVVSVHESEVAAKAECKVLNRAVKHDRKDERPVYRVTFYNWVRPV